MRRKEINVVYIKMREDEREVYEWLKGDEREEGLK
jgi:hypothetical protein